MSAMVSFAIDIEFSTDPGRKVLPALPQTMRTNVEHRVILPMPALVAYNARRAEGPCGKTMLSVAATSVTGKGKPNVYDTS